MTDHHIEGGSCFCGGIVAELHGQPFWICYDHDDDCRRAVGSPLTIWAGIRPEQFGLVRGQAKSFSKTEGLVRTFCPNCGTSIGYRDRALPDELYVTIGVFDRPEAFRPEAHAYWGLRLLWAEFADSLPDVDGYSRLRDAAIGKPSDRQKAPRP